MSEQLQANGNPVKVGGVTLRTPGLAGTATSYATNASGLRAITRTTDELEQALTAQGLQTTETIEITRTLEVPSPAGRTRSTSFDEPAIELQVPDPGDQWGQVVLYTDEAGVTTWSFAADDQGGIDVTRGRASRTYLIPRRVSASGPPAATRGLVSAVGKKVLKVLVFPLIDPVLGEIGDYFAARWENAKRPYGLRSFTPDTYNAPAAATSLTDADWQRMAQGPALMLVHGTFSRASTAFAGLTKEAVAELNTRYDGRVFAFDHFTLSQSPRENIDWLLQTIPDGLKLNLDIVSHSRGGLVSRVLAEDPHLALGTRQVNVRRLIFVASPNAGTTLADVEHWSSLVDTYTNILNFFPDVGISDTLDAIVTVVKQIAVGAVKGLDGLSSMQPKGAFLTALNKGPRSATRYYALASNFEPTAESGVGLFAKDILFDKLFNADNDLVVPTGGVWDKNGSDRFPIEDRRVFSGDAAIQHGGYFSNALARQQVLDWLAP